eukprot:CAMPEP_0175850156 /NCGR_PEP_ID=MMETSP0107_2-20121207/24934_1 /TAXON_ID=195067 ORGANISM="Goniomonas pacifica, Strain CCMP1869" /NCGR_SAMPLE_ID=MMETSP0107_2 /ASSEMBLY_ACC=CAM_ASM_000203 /LENGTH=41 /DNA_ID= /DNA_START= /DNA_END= /DNA_ORIENTATION=
MAESAAGSAKVSSDMCSNRFFRSRLRKYELQVSFTSMTKRN